MHLCTNPPPKENSSQEKWIQGKGVDQKEIMVLIRLWLVPEILSMIVQNKNNMIPIQGHYQNEVKSEDCRNYTKIKVFYS